MPWHAKLQLDYRADDDGRSLARHRHAGPLRILQSLYPEGAAVCHNVLVHPPSGVVAGDLLDVGISVGPGAHGLVTTPGATRFYRSDGASAIQQTRIALAEGARFEWLPLASICSSGCIAENHLKIEAAPGAELIGWDSVALGLPGASQPFLAGSYLQRIEVPGVWLERGRIDAADERLMNGALGLAGHRCLASIFLVAGAALARDRRAALLDAARAVIDAHPLVATAGATSPTAQLVVVRMLAPLVEPAFDLLRRIRAAWRAEAWGMAATEPRGWSL